MKSLEEMISKLPSEYQQEVEDSVEFLLEKQLKRQRKKPKFDWAGALNDLRNQYTTERVWYTRRGC